MTHWISIDYRSRLRKIVLLANYTVRLLSEATATEMGYILPLKTRVAANPTLRHLL